MPPNRTTANAPGLSTLVPKAAAAPARAHPGLEPTVIDRHPVEAPQALRHGETGVALVFRRTDVPAGEESFRLVRLTDDPIHAVTYGEPPDPPAPTSLVQVLLD